MVSAPPRVRGVLMVCLITVAAAAVAAQISQWRGPHEDTLQAGAELCRRGRWDEAIPLLNRHLLDHPDDVRRNTAAHFFLGQAYLFGSDPYLPVAEGELELALAMFIKNGRKSPIAEFSDTYFELRCHLELAKVHLRALDTAIFYNARQELLRAIYGKCLDEAEKARQVAPDSPDVAQLDEVLRDLALQIETPRRRPAMPPAPSVAV
ncbi:MAG: hypothetical protein GWP08_13465 [Nitrospiraceae bacterium]|nr:hypothetical protein [Nitrospiraceae bacterium]